MGKKRFEYLLFKNTAAIAFPAIIILIVLVFMFMKYPVLEYTKASDITTSDNLYNRISDVYSSGNSNIRIETGKLSYAGFDYYVNGKVKGAYYYQMEKDHLIFYIIETTHPKMVIEDATIKARIVKDNISTEYMINQLMDSGEISGKIEDKFYSEFVISECDYPKNYIRMLYVLFASPIVISVLIIAYTILIWFNPALHGQAKQLKDYGEPQAIIDELDIEMRNHLIYKINNIYITKNYLIVSYLVKTDVIKLDMLKEIEKSEVEKYFLPWKKQKLFKLRFYTRKKTEYEIELKNEETLNNIIDYVSVICKETY
ncbi:MAG: hypothetical protein IJ141_00645 [Lachnospiraceae bacterium]|nr:hypothetical protein [Lachnospiraceae bacterium]